MRQVNVQVRPSRHKGGQIRPFRPKGGQNEKAGQTENEAVRPVLGRTWAGQTEVVKRWIVERTIAWLNRCRRLTKDWECLNQQALAFLHLASIRLMLRKLCRTTI